MVRRAVERLPENMTFPFFDILILAMIAAFIILRLRSVLGRRTGNERPPRNPYTHRKTSRPPAAGKADSNVVTLPGTRNGAAALQPPGIFDAYAPEGSALAKGLMAIQLQDRSFEPASFLTGAKTAYEMVITAFAAGDRTTLRPLLSPGVFENFDHVIAEREEKGTHVETNLVSIEKAEFVEATLRDRIAELTVKFISEIISATKNSEGAVIEGDPISVRRVTDVWTFARDTSSADPNWRLVGTAAAAA